MILLGAGVVTLLGCPTKTDSVDGGLADPAGEQGAQPDAADPTTSDAPELVEWSHFQVQRVWGPCPEGEICVGQWDLASEDHQIDKTFMGKTSTVLMDVDEFRLVDGILSGTAFLAAIDQGFGCEGLVTDVVETMTLELADGRQLSQDATNCAFGYQAQDPVLKLHSLVTRY